MERLGNVFSFRGRTTRLGYWQLQLLLAVVLVMIVFGAIGITGLGGEVARGTGIAIAALAAIPCLIISLANGVRRLHDRNRSGVWILLYWIGPDLLAEMAKQFEHDENLVLLALALSLGSIIVAVWGLIEIGFRRGTRGPNRFGDDPMQPTSEVFA